MRSNAGLPSPVNQGMLLHGNRCHTPILQASSCSTCTGSSLRRSSRGGLSAACYRSGGESGGRGGHGETVELFKQNLPVRCTR